MCEGEEHTSDNITLEVGRSRRKATERQDTVKKNTKECRAQFSMSQKLRKEKISVRGRKNTGQHVKSHR
jgi:hypothetical protein